MKWTQVGGSATHCDECISQKCRWRCEECVAIYIQDTRTLFTNANTHAYTVAHMHTRLNTLARACAHTCAQTHTHTHTHTHTQTHTHTHARAHTHTQARPGDTARAVLWLCGVCCHSGVLCEAPHGSCPLVPHRCVTDSHCNGSCCDHL